MKKHILIIIAILILSTALLADTVAVLSSSKGKITLERKNKNIKFKNGELLKNEDVLRTGVQSFATYKYVDASSQIKLFANSVVTISANKVDGKLAKKVGVTKGNVYSQIKSGTGPFVVQTPTTVASVKGTEFMTRVDDDGNSEFIVVEGEIDLEVPGTGQSGTVGAGQTGSVIGGDLIIGDTPAGALSDEEMNQIENPESNTMIIPYQDESGESKYIRITY